MTHVHIEYDGIAQYPEYDFNPDTAYPEYPFPEKLNAGENPVYRKIRNSLIAMNLDKANVGSPDWNPFGDLVVPGQTIIIKPNWVLHQNNNKSASRNAMECLVTHGSVIRAVCDYCVIALKGEGKIIIGDAPVQDCDLEQLFEKMHYGEIDKFYRSQGIDFVSMEDFRAYRTYMSKAKVITGKTAISDGVDINLGDLSMHDDAGEKGHFYHVANYDKAVTTECHSNGKHIYSISKTALSADLIINLLKPKCHRYAGLTGALKNLVGIANRKETLPHRKSLSAEEGGDSYRYKSTTKRIADYGLEKKVALENAGRTKLALLTWLFTGFFCLVGMKATKDPYLLGSWYGNDTIWRTCVDLNYIMEHADKEGVLQDSSQRKMFCLADMIVAGEKCGPLSPSPKELGIIMASDNAAALDAVLCKLMGFPYEKIPSVREVILGKTLLHYEEPVITFNDDATEYTQKEAIFPKSWRFEPHENWKMSENRNAGTLGDA